MTVGPLVASIVAQVASPPAGASDQGEATLQLIRIFVALVGVAALVTLLARRFSLPYTVALVACGMAIGALAQPYKVEITPQLVLVVLLPGLIFEAAYHTDFDKLRPSIPGVSLLAGPGVLISAAVIALFLNVGAGVRLDEAFVVGAMLSATDPVAVIATFKKLGSPRRLSTMVEAESLFNDGTGIVVFAIAVAFVSRPVGPIEVVASFISVVLVSVAIGLVTGFIASRILPSVGDHLIEVSLSVVLAYGTYLAADAFHQSGVIAAAVSGLMLGTYGRRRGISDLTIDSLDIVWDFVAFLLTALVFLLIGFAITLTELSGAALAIAWAVVGTLVARAAIVYGLLGGLQYARRRLLDRGVRTPGVEDEGQPLPTEWLHVIFWAGLRGAVSTALALSLPGDFPNRDLLQGITLGVVLFTLLVQATTAGRVVHRFAPVRPAVGLATPRAGAASPGAAGPGAAAVGAPATKARRAGAVVRAAPGVAARGSSGSSPTRSGPTTPGDPP